MGKCLFAHIARVAVLLIMLSPPMDEQEGQGHELFLTQATLIRLRLRMKTTMQTQLPAALEHLLTNNTDMLFFPTVHIHVVRHAACCLKILSTLPA